jgi:F0F1-type ATP synthase membrane subunit b/b'
MNANGAPPEAPVEQGVEEQVGATPEVEASEDDSGIGARVTAVFTAAEKAGQHIVTLAREEAEDIRREARAEADAYLREQKLQADKEVEQIFADARRKAESIEEDSRIAARQVEDDARVRKERLREEARLIEERIAWAKEGLGEVNDRLEEVFLESEPLALQPNSDS